jgi:hypothetical protein
VGVTATACLTLRGRSQKARRVINVDGVEPSTLDRNESLFTSHRDPAMAGAIGTRRIN